MATNKLEQQYPQFFELNGIALNDGYVYIGVDGLDPITNPKTVYLDEALTTPISQPLRTTGGYIYSGGSPVSIYFAGTYSITVKNSLSELIYTNLNAFDYINSKISYKDGVIITTNIASLKLINGSISPQVEMLGYYSKGDFGGGLFYWDSASTETDNGGTIIQATGVATGRWKRRIDKEVNVRWFGAKGDAVTNDYATFSNALATGYNLYIPKGEYYLASTITISAPIKIYGDGIGITKLLKHSTNANNTCLDIKSSNTLFEDFEINIQSGSNVLTDGYGIKLFSDTVAYQSNRANRIKIQNQNNGVGIIETMITASPYTAYRPTKTYFDNIEVLDSNAIAIEVDGGNDTYFSNVLIDTSRGYGGVEVERGSGVFIKRTEGLWLDKIEALDCFAGIWFQPQNAAHYIKYIFISNSAFDTNAQYGAVVSTYLGGEIHSVNFNNCWFASNGAQPTEDNVDARGIIIHGYSVPDQLTQISFNQCRIFNNGRHGVELNSCRNISFNNCEVSGNGNKASNTYDGIFVGTDADSLRITNTYSAPTAGFTSTQRYGINLSSNTCTGVIVTSNFTSNNLTGGINDAGVTYSVIDNNIV